MFTAAAVLAVSFVLCGLVQILFVGRFHRFARHRSVEAPAEWTPKAAVVLCVRGYDPCLDACLEGLFKQDYPHYVVHVVVDSLSDPAWPLLARWQESAGRDRLRVSALRDRRKTCSLKCSSLVQAMDELLPDEEVVVMIDADVAPLPNWLSMLVKPLHDPTVGLSTGNRWFEPRPGMWGTSVRSCWNGGAVVQMLNFDVPWGGSLAMRRADVEKHRVVDNWARSFNDDVILGNIFSQADKRVHRVPEMLIINREDIALPQLVEWVTRQCIHVKHYHRRGQHIVILNLVLALMTMIHLILPPVLLFSGQAAAAGLLAAGLAGYLLNQIALGIWIEVVAQNVLRRQQQTVARLGARLLWVLPVTHIVYCWSFAGSLFRRRLKWRGIWYHIHAPLDVEVVHDAPFEESRAAQSMSIV